jgi:hypothetical protein
LSFLVTIFSWMQAMSMFHVFPKLQQSFEAIEILLSFKCFDAHLLNKWSLWLYVSNDCCETHEFYIQFSARNVHQTCKCHCCSRFLVQTFAIAYAIMFSKHSIMHDVKRFLFDFKDNVLVHIIYHYVFYWCTKHLSFVIVCVL